MYIFFENKYFIKGRKLREQCQNSLNKKNKTDFYIIPLHWG